MTNEQKTDILTKHLPLIKSIVNRYFIKQFTHEELTQEVLTHLSNKLDQFDPNRSKITTFISVVCNNKLSNMVAYDKRKKREEYDEIPEEIDNIEFLLNVLCDRSPNERLAIEVAYDVLYMLGEKEQRVVKKTLMNQKQQVIAEEEGVTQGRVSQIWKEYINKVRSEL